MRRPASEPDGHVDVRGVHHRAHRVAVRIEHDVSVHSSEDSAPARQGVTLPVRKLIGLPSPRLVTQADPDPVLPGLHGDRLIDGGVGPGGRAGNLSGLHYELGTSLHQQVSRP